MNINVNTKSQNGNGNPGDDRGEREHAALVKSWNQIQIYKRRWTGSDTYVMERVADDKDRAKVLIQWTKENELPEDYSFYGFTVIDGDIHVLRKSAPESEHRLVHAFSLDAFFINDDGEPRKTYDVTERAAYGRAVMGREKYHPRLQPWFFRVDWTGIQDAANREGSLAAKLRKSRI